MAQSIALFLFSRKLLQDAEKREAEEAAAVPDSEDDAKTFDDIPLDDDDVPDKNATPPGI